MSPDAPAPWQLHDLLGVPASSAHDHLEPIVVAATGSVPDRTTTRSTPVAYAFGSPATAALHRVSGTDLQGTPWSLFCKVLQHPRHWTGLARLPPPVAADFVARFPWRAETDLWDPVTQATLPQGLRSPQLHLAAPLGPDHLALWQEDVVESGSAWDLDRFGRAARLLARWNARSTGPEVISACPGTRGEALREYAEQAVPARGLGPLRDDALWDHPWLRPHAGLRSRLLRLATRIPAALDLLDEMVQAVPHGDASPQNLLVPADAPSSFVVIDLSFRAPHALGFDLAQLLTGLTQAGSLSSSHLPAVHEVLVQGYLAGLHDEGVAGQDDHVRTALALTALLRSGFDGFAYDLLPRAATSVDGDGVRRHAFDERVALSALVADHAETVLH